LLKSLATEPHLSRINARLLPEIAVRLGIAAPIIHCTELAPRDALLRLDRTARLIALCQAAGATRYLVGPAAKSYLDEELFRAHGIEVAWMSYEGYPDYPQLWGDFEPRVSIVDLLLNTGAAAASYFPPIAENGQRAADQGPVKVGHDSDDRRAMACGAAPSK
jgi:hypothetical protein